MKTKTVIFIFAAFFLTAFAAQAAEVKNVITRQVGNRVQITYDLAGDENEADVSVSAAIGGTEHKADALHMEGDLGKVKPGKGKTIWWNVLQDFPRGLDKDVTFDVTAGGKSFTDPNTGMEMVFVKGGCYRMGDTFGDGWDDEKPVHEVCINDFYIGKYEVTQGQWKAVMGENPSSFKNCGDNCPVETVSWNDIQQFLQRLNSRSGKQYRLPTEAEWEYAARSGGKSEKYAGGNDVDAVAWYYKNSGSNTHPLGQKRPNGLGLYDMSGNVWEWCSDWYGEKYYSQSPRDNPDGPSSGSYRVLRGGSWGTRPGFVRAAYRVRFNPGVRVYGSGFRMALSAR
ncbi:MAG: formylglycine-generating enzyme family protein [Smithella sp.]|nr:formylglycine-generating enzyme family protein [Smithella sp.]